MLFTAVSHLVAGGVLWAWIQYVISIIIIINRGPTYNNILQQIKAKEDILIIFVVC